MVNSLPVRGLICVWSCVILMACCGSAEAARRGRTGPKPKERLSFYVHDILYNGHNEKNATSAIVAAPQGANLTSLSGRKMNFGDVVVFDDPITLQPRLRAPQIGRAQGFYFYDQKLRLSAWLAFTAVLDTPRHKGTLCFAGADPIYKKTRDIAVVGGTGDFVLARGIATVMTHSFEDTVYFRLLLNVSLY